MIGVTASVRSGVSRVPVCGARRARVSDRLSAPSLDAIRLGCPPLKGKFRDHSTAAVIGSGLIDPLTISARCDCACTDIGDTAV